MTAPYREPSAVPDLDWWEKSAPSEKERLLWVQFCEMFIMANRRYTVLDHSDPSVNADSMMVDHRKRFGEIK